jgi:hypothetical protein
MRALKGGYKLMAVMKPSTALYASPKMAGWRDDLSWCCHSWVRARRVSTAKDLIRAREAGAYPGQPGAAVGAKGDAPCGLEGLEVLVWLEEGAHAEGVDEAEEEEHAEDVADLGRRDLGVYSVHYLLGLGFRFLCPGSVLRPDRL